jgi:thymidine kinase
VSNPPSHPSGTLRVIIGPMFSGKSTALVAALRAHHDLGREVLALRPARDTRDLEPSLVTHDGVRWPALRVQHAEEILKRVPPGVHVVGIEECNMLGDALVQVCMRLVREGFHVICAGLNLDYRALPFDPMPALVSYADEVVVRTARCARCDAPARFSQRLSHEDLLILPGGAESYEPRCARCYNHAPDYADHPPAATTAAAPPLDLHHGVS